MYDYNSTDAAYDGGYDGGYDACTDILRAAARHKHQHHPLRDLALAGLVIWLLVKICQYQTGRRILLSLLLALAGLGLWAHFASHPANPATEPTPEPTPIEWTPPAKDTPVYETK
jgi:hypothetical protein